jgi:hypothetical protein
MAPGLRRSTISVFCFQNLDGDLFEVRGVLGSVMSAEDEVSAAGQNCPDLGSRTAPVATLAS